MARTKVSLALVCLAEAHCNYRRATHRCHGIRNRHHVETGVSQSCTGADNARTDPGDNDVRSMVPCERQAGVDVDRLDVAAERVPTRDREVEEPGRLQ